MIKTFPTPYPDELLYSTFARHQKWVGYRSAMNTMEDLVGTRSASAVHDFPYRLELFCRQFPPGAFESECIINNCTMLPAYQPFLEKAQYEKVKSYMKGAAKGCNIIYLIIGLSSSPVGILKNLRYCLSCFNEDRNNYGEAFWHRSHQFPVVKVCHKHHEYLVDSEVMVCSQNNKYNLCALEDVKFPEEAKISTKKPSEKDIWLSEKIYWLLQNPKKPLGLDVLKDRYKELLFAKGFASHMGRIRSNELAVKFVEFFGDDYLQKLNCAMDPQKDTAWLLSIVRKRRRSIHPIRHLLLMLFLDGDPAFLLQENFEISKPFGAPPYPCLNPVCSDFRELVINEVEIGRNSKAGFPVGRFKCSCGFSYIRSGSDSTKEDRFRFTRVRSFGPVWEQKLLEMDADTSIPLTEKAKILGVCVETLLKKLKELKFSSNHVDVLNSESEEKILLENRGELLSFMAQNPSYTRTQIQKSIGKIYNWLYRNDKEWFYENLPEKAKIDNTGNNKIDWQSRDDELFQKVQNAVAQILRNEEKTEMVSKNNIGKKSCCYSMLQNCLDNLPKTKHLLSLAVESWEEFQIRKVRWAAKRIIEEGGLLADWSVAKKARLRPTYSEKVKMEIKKLVEGFGCLF